MRDSKVLGGLSPYDPKCIPASTLLSANESPSDVPAEVKLACLERIQKTPFNRYPHPAANELRELLASKLYEVVLPTLDDGMRNGLALPDVAPEQIVVGNGGDELLFNFMMAFGGPGNGLLITPPAFSVYEIDAHMTKTELIEVPMRDDFSIDEDAVLERASQNDVNMVILTSPNNPTGGLVSAKFLERLLQSTQAVVMVDEAYGEFAEKTSIPLVGRYPNLCILRTFSKAYSLAGVRLGYIVASKQVADRFLMVRQPYSVDSVSQAIGEEVVRRCHLYKPVVRGVIARRASLLQRLGCISGIEVFDSAANFVMARMKGATAVWESMVEQGVLVRNFDGHAGLDGCLRITVGTEEENQAMLDALASGVLKGFGQRGDA